MPRLVLFILLIGATCCLAKSRENDQTQQEDAKLSSAGAPSLSTKIAPMSLKESRSSTISAKTSELSAQAKLYGEQIPLLSVDNNAQQLSQPKTLIRKRRCGGGDDDDDDVNRARGVGRGRRRRRRRRNRRSRNSSRSSRSSANTTSNELSRVTRRRGGQNATKKQTTTTVVTKKVTQNGQVVSQTSSKVLDNGQQPLATTNQQQQKNQVIATNEQPTVLKTATQPATIVQALPSVDVQGSIKVN